MRKPKLTGLAVLLIMFVGIFVILTALNIPFSWLESRTYNRLTGAKTTWWDAMWVELRVMDCPHTKEIQVHE